MLALVPYLDVDTHGVFSSELSSPGSLQLLGLCLVFGGVALTYDLLFGFTGLLSFGHALYFAVGVYLTAIATTRWDWSLGKTLALVAVVGARPAVRARLRQPPRRRDRVRDGDARVRGGRRRSSCDKNPNGWTGGEEGTPVAFEALPEAFVGVLNTKNLYWLALGYLVVVSLIVHWSVDSSPGRVWQAIRENEPRVEVLGLHPFRFKLAAFVLSSFLATAGGVVYVLLVGGATPAVTTPAFTLSLLLMVVLGGTGHALGRRDRRDPLHVPRQPPHGVDGDADGAGSAERAARAAVRAAVRPRDAVHPARLLPARAGSSGLGWRAGRGAACAARAAASGGEADARDGA